VGHYMMAQYIRGVLHLGFDCLIIISALSRGKSSNTLRLCLAIVCFSGGKKGK
jgi:hypothetical protein